MKLGLALIVVAAVLSQLLGSAGATPVTTSRKLPPTALAFTASAGGRTAVTAKAAPKRPVTTTTRRPVTTTTAPAATTTTAPAPATTTTAPRATTTTAPRAATTTAPAATTTTAPVRAVAATGLRIGISYGDTLPGLTRAVLDQELNDANALGVGWVRLDLAWDDIQPNSPSVYQWAAFDQIVADATARHLTLLPILSYTPQWARPANCATDDKCAPADPNAFAAFARAAAARYAPLGVHTWEIWNEPNITVFWQPQPNAAGYVTLLRATAAAIRAVDPTATLVSGGLSPAPTADGNISQLDFLTAFAKLGGPAVVDAVGYHPYSFPVRPGYSAGWNAWQQISATPTSFQSVLAAYGFGTKKIWLTEYGAPTNGPGVGATMTNYQLGANPDHVDEGLQAAMATDSVALASSSPIVGALFWYSYRDIGTSTGDTENFYGLRRFNGTPKPAYTALQQAIAATR